MKVTLNSVQNFKQSLIEQAKVSHNVVHHQDLTTSNSSQNSGKDMVVAQNINPTQKKTNGSWIKRAIGNVWKFFSVTGTMANATAKGLLYGFYTFAVALGAGFLLKVPNAVKTAKNIKMERINTILASGKKFKNPKSYELLYSSIKKVITNPLKTIGTSGKIIAGVLGALVFTGHLIAGKLKANQDTAVIDHKLKIGHRD